MISLLAVLLAQAPVISNQGKGLTDGGSWTVTCTNCSGSSSGGGTIDGGDVRASQGAGQDGGAWNVTAASLPLPTGASTEATLATLLTSGTFTARLGTLGQKTMAGSTPVVIASDQAAFPVTLASTTVTGSVAVTGPLTDAQLRATAVPISAASLPLPSGAATESTLALVKAKTDNLDVLLSTRTKPADQQHVIIDSSASIAVTGPLTDTQLRASSLPVAGVDPGGTSLTLRTDTNGVQYVISAPTRPLNPFLPRCNPVRRTGCQP